MLKSFISNQENDMFYLFRGLDLQELLFQIENYYLEYRGSLNLSEDVTFGVEIEYEDIKKDKIDSYISHHINKWISKEDGSLRPGGEINSPIMTDKVEYWKELKFICDYLSQERANMSCNAGGHIHIGARLLGNDLAAWKLFLKLYMCYESVLFRFLYGDKLNGRNKILKYAYPAADILYDHLDSIDSSYSMNDLAHSLYTDTRYRALNLVNVNFNDLCELDGNTIEFRSPNATSEAVIIQNNINAIAKLCVTARDKVIDEEFLDYILKYEFYPFNGNEYLYSTINLKKVLEFVDLIFDNNLDKAYFLRQYLKNFQENYEIKYTNKAKRFVR